MSQLKCLQLHNYKDIGISTIPCSHIPTVIRDVTLIIDWLVMGIPRLINHKWLWRLNLTEVTGTASGCMHDTMQAAVPVRLTDHGWQKLASHLFDFAAPIYLFRCIQCNDSMYPSDKRHICNYTFQISFYILFMWLNFLGYLEWSW